MKEGPEYKRWSVYLKNWRNGEGLKNCDKNAKLIDSENWIGFSERQNADIGPFSVEILHNANLSKSVYFRNLSILRFCHNFSILRHFVNFWARHFIFWILGLLPCNIKGVFSKLVKMLKLARPGFQKWWAESASPMAARGKIPRG